MKTAKKNIITLATLMTMLGQAPQALADYPFIEEPIDTASSAWHMSDSGYIVGTALNSQNIVRIHPAEGTLEIPLPQGATRCFAPVVSNAGVVAFRCRVPVPGQGTADRGFVFQNGAVLPLELLPGGRADYSYPVGIAGDGRVLARGVFYDQQNNFHSIFPFLRLLNNEVQRVQTDFPGEEWGIDPAGMSRGGAFYIGNDYTSGEFVAAVNGTSVEYPQLNGNALMISGVDDYGTVAVRTVFGRVGLWGGGLFGDITPALEAGLGSLSDDRYQIRGLNNANQTLVGRLNNYEDYLRAAGVYDPSQSRVLKFESDFSGDGRGICAVGALLDIDSAGNALLMASMSGVDQYGEPVCLPSQPVKLHRQHFQPGDANCDGAVNNFDVDAFAQLLTDSEIWGLLHTRCNQLEVGDINSDGLVNNFDVDPFVDLLL
ncbi:MAG: hypothetical protein QY326_05215 [Bdellovibrionota bacterium]|nr:MAG: hypothetical protein QY326_05215 [Bdellovibrionota bacterium]